MTFHLSKPGKKEQEHKGTQNMETAFISRTLITQEDNQGVWGAIPTPPPPKHWALLAAAYPHCAHPPGCGAILLPQLKTPPPWTPYNSPPPNVVVPAGKMLNSGVCVSVWQHRGRSWPRRKQQRLRRPKSWVAGQPVSSPPPIHTYPITTTELESWARADGNKIQRLDSNLFLGSDSWSSPS